MEAEWVSWLKELGVNIPLALVVWKLWQDRISLEKELRDTHKQQAEFWREIARSLEVKQ